MSEERKRNITQIAEETQPFYKEIKAQVDRIKRQKAIRLEAENMQKVLKKLLERPVKDFNTPQKFKSYINNIVVNVEGLIDMRKMAPHIGSKKLTKLLSRALKDLEVCAEFADSKNIKINAAAFLAKYYYECLEQATQEKSGFFTVLKEIFSFSNNPWSKCEYYCHMAINVGDPRGHYYLGKRSQLNGEIKEAAMYYFQGAMYNHHNSQLALEQLKPSNECEDCYIMLCQGFLQAKNNQPQAVNTFINAFEAEPIFFDVYYDKLIERKLLDRKTEDNLLMQWLEEKPEMPAELWISFYRRLNMRVQSKNKDLKQKINANKAWFAESLNKILADNTSPMTNGLRRAKGEALNSLRTLAKDTPTAAVYLAAYYLNHENLSPQKRHYWQAEYYRGKNNLAGALKHFHLGGYSIKLRRPPANTYNASLYQLYKWIESGEPAYLKEALAIDQDIFVTSYLTIKEDVGLSPEQEREILSEIEPNRLKHLFEGMCKTFDSLLIASWNDNFLAQTKKHISGHLHSLKSLFSIWFPNNVYYDASKAAATIDQLAKLVSKKVFTVIAGEAAESRSISPEFRARLLLKAREFGSEHDEKLKKYFSIVAEESPAAKELLETTFKAEREKTLAAHAPSAPPIASEVPSEVSVEDPKSTHSKESAAKRDPSKTKEPATSASGKRKKSTMKSKKQHSIKTDDAKKPVRTKQNTVTPSEVSVEDPKSTNSKESAAKRDPSKTKKPATSASGKRKNRKRKPKKGPGAKTDSAKTSGRTKQKTAPPKPGRTEEKEKTTAKLLKSAPEAPAHEFETDTSEQKNPTSKSRTPTLAR